MLELKLRSKSTVSVGSLLFGVVALLVAIGIASVPHPGSTESQTSLGVGSVGETCTIAAQTASIGIALDETVAAGSNAIAALTNALAAEPGSSVVEERTGLARSGTIPIVNAHNVVIVRLAGVGAMPVTGPVGAGQVRMSTPSCVIAVYDADNGNKLVEFGTL